MMSVSPKEGPNPLKDCSGTFGNSQSRDWHDREAESWGVRPKDNTWVRARSALEVVQR